jgi:TolB protein
MFKVRGENRLPGKIAFSSYTGETWQLWRMNPDGQNLFQLTNEFNDLHYPAWSHDGRKLAYADYEGIIWVMVLGETPRRLPFLPKNCTHPAWSPDDRKIAFTCYTFQNRKEDSDIWIADLEKKKARKLIAQEGIQKHPNWSPDGSTIVYSNGYRLNSNKIVESLWLMDHDGGNPRSLLTDNASNIQPDWSPKGEKIVFASDQSGNLDIWVLDIEGGNQHQLTNHKSYDADPAWSPSGSQICFSSTRSGKPSLWLLNLEGGPPRQFPGLFGAKVKSKEPDWSLR